MKATTMNRTLVMSALILGSFVLAAPAPAQTQSGAVQQYEDYRRWRDQGHKGDYEDYLEWKRQRGQSTTSQPVYVSTQAPPRDRDDDRDDDEWERDDDDWDDDDRLEGDREDWDRDRRDRDERYRQPMPPAELDRRPRLPGHEECLNHYDDVIMFDRFPCRVVRPCKECHELITFQAISYDYDSKGLLDDIEYRDEMCPRCHKKAKLKVSFRD